MERRGDSRSRILLYFLLGIVLPSCLLAYLAYRGIQNERALVERERRTELEAVAERLAATIESELAELERAVRSARPEELAALVRERTAIHAVFTVDSTRRVRIATADRLFFGHDSVGRETKSTGKPTSHLARGRQLELGARDLRGALDLYLLALEEAETKQVRAEALSRVARVQRKLGRWAPSVDAYGRLRSDFDHVRSSAGIPFGAVAALELGTLHLERGDTARAALVTLQLYSHLVQGRWTLTPARFDLLASSGREILEPLAAIGALPVSSDTLASLGAEEERRRIEALELSRFEESAGRLLLQAARGEGPVRGNVDTGTQTFAAVLLADGYDQGPTRRGFIVHPSGLARRATSAIGNAAHRFAWSLQTPSGDIIAASDVPAAQEAPTLPTGLTGFPGWSLRLGHSPEAVSEHFLTSRRAVYLYAFTLIAGILLSGLILTLRTVGRELELARMKSDFISTVTHEFKSPLTAIRQLAEMLREGRVGSDERRSRYYDVLLEQSERLSRLVDNVLDFSRLEGGRRELTLEPVDAASLVEETVCDARQRVAHTGFDIRTELAEPLPAVALDGDAFRQALGNLIDNGVKYSGTSREVVVRSYPENGSLVVAVQDFGIGMSAEETGRVFERFYRGGDELTRTVKGTGLGLTLVKQIVEAHGGTVEVTSDPGRGSTFTMHFPPVGCSGRLENGPDR